MGVSAVPLRRAAVLRRDRCEGREGVGGGRSRRGRAGPRVSRVLVAGSVAATSGDTFLVFYSFAAPLAIDVPYSEQQLGALLEHMLSELNSDEASRKILPRTMHADLF